VVRMGWELWDERGEGIRDVLEERSNTTDSLLSILGGAGVEWRPHTTVKFYKRKGNKGKGQWKWSFAQGESKKQAGY